MDAADAERRIAAQAGLREVARGVATRELCADGSVGRLQAEVEAALTAAIALPGNA